MSNENESSASGAPAVEQKVGAPPPPLDEKARAEAKILSEKLRDDRVRGQRSLFINVMLMFLVSIVVFVIGTYYFVVPQIIRQDLDVRQLVQNANKLSARVARIEQALAGPAAAPAAVPAKGPDESKGGE